MPRARRPPDRPAGVIPLSRAGRLTPEQIAKTETDPVRKAIALTWLFHLVGDVHQPLHTVQIVTTDYPNGDRGGNAICVRAPSGNSMDLHRFWDGVITSSNNTARLKNEATTLINRPELAMD